MCGMNEMTGINLYWKDFDNNWTNVTRFSEGKNCN